MLDFNLSGDMFYDPAFPVSEVELARQRFEDEQRKKREQKAQRSNLSRDTSEETAESE